MPESALLTQIRNDYCAQLADKSPCRQAVDRDLIEMFCKYAANWLVEKGCLGVGYAASGLTLRFADGRELSLFEAAPVAPETPTAVAISTVKDKLVAQTMADRTQAVSITGRQ